MGEKKTSRRHRWTYEECEIVCSIFKSECVDSSNSVDTVISKIEESCPSLSKGSIRMKLQNTVCICNELGIKHSCDVASLSDYSQQHMDAFKLIFGIDS